MSYNAVVEMAMSQSLYSRIVAAAASEGIPTPDSWVGQNKWRFAASPGWDADWQFAKDNATINNNPDIGARDDVINDAAILAAVQALNPNA